MKRNIVAFALVTVVLGFISARCTGTEKPSIRKSPAVYIEKLDSTPDLTQTDPNGRLPNGGKAHCGPVAVANSLAWLADKGFDNLAPGLPRREEAQFEIARLLGTKKYMNTNLKTGTGAGGLLEGVSRYIKDKGYDYRYLGYQGWRKHPRQFSSGAAVPELRWIKGGLKGDSAVWFNIGWYKYTSSSDEYVRIGGHWVTLAGYGVDQKGNEDPAIVIIHDPAPRAGKRPSHEYVRVKLIKSGLLTGQSYGLPCKAQGRYILADGMHVKRTADFAILDGAVVLKMHKKMVKKGR